MPLFRTAGMSLPGRALLAAAIVIVVGSPAAAQSSREEVLAREQAEKAKSLSPPKRNRVERFMLDIENAGGFGVQRGLFFTFGDIKSGSGLALGPAYGRTLKNGAILQAKGAYSIRNFKMVQLFAQAPKIGDGRLVVNGRARWQDAPLLPVYALGTAASRDRADYAETKTEVSGQAFYRPIRFLRFGGGTSFERFDTGSADGRNPSVEVKFAPAQMPGIGADPTYLHSHASAAIDTLAGPGFSRSGSYLGGTVHDYRQQNSGPYSFRRTDAMARQLIPLLNGNWVIDLSLRASTTSAGSGDTVPFFLMPTLGGGSALRGYGNYRFRDRNSLLFTAEYRWYAQEFVEMALFYDAGKVEAKRADLDFDGLKSNFGIGMRLHGPQTTAVRLEVAKGNEGLRLIISFSPAIP
jgi:surface antigen Omp85-like protein